MTLTRSRSARAVVAGALALCAVATVGDAMAAVRPKVKPVCNLIPDAKGDVDPTFDRPSTDIVSADIAIDASTLTWVIRTAGAIADKDPANLGRRWLFNFTAEGKQHSFIAYSGPTGLREHTAAGARVSLDISGRELRYTLTLAQFETYTKRRLTPGKSVVTGMWAFMATGIDHANGQLQNPGGDRADGQRSYLAGRSSCVTPLR